MGEAKKILGSLAGARLQIKKLEKTLAIIEKRMDALTAEGLEYGTTYYREEKYFYVNSCVNGLRTRRYVGTDPEKIKEVFAAKQRAKEYEDLKAKRLFVDERLSDIEWKCVSIHSVLSMALRSVEDIKEQAVQTLGVPPGGGLQHRLDGGVDVVDAQCRVVKGEGESKGLPDNLRRELLKKQIKKELAAQGVLEPFLTAQAVCRLRSEHGL